MSTDMIDPAKPIRPQVTALVIQHITSGEYAVHDRIASERDFAAKLGISRQTVRSAYQAAAAEGYLTTDPTLPSVGWIVRKPGPNRVIDSSRYAAEDRRLATGDTDRWTHYTRGMGAEWDDYRVEASTTIGTPTEIEANHLGIGEHVEVIRREMTEYVHGRPTQIRMSVVRSTEATQPMAAAGHVRASGGTLAELADCGIRPNGCWHRMTTRIADEDESVRLQIPHGAPVTDITRVFHANADPVEYSVLTIPAIGLAIEWDDQWPLHIPGDSTAQELEAAAADIQHITNHHARGNEHQAQTGIRKVIGRLTNLIKGHTT